MSRPVILTVAFERPFSKFAPGGSFLLCQERVCFGVLTDPVKMIREDLNAMPLIVPTICRSEDVPELIKRADGLLLPGGDANIHPSLYKHERCPKTVQIFDPNRDNLEIALLNEAYRQKKPVLGICRGMQMINVWRGGTMHQSYPQGHKPNHMLSIRNFGKDDGIDVTHGLVLAEDSRLAQWIGDDRSLRVNSLHEQYINTLGKDLVAEAHAEDGTIEAIRLEDDNAFIYGVQWHPDFNGKAIASAAVLRGYRRAVDKRRKKLWPLG